MVRPSNHQQYSFDFTVDALPATAATRRRVSLLQRRIQKDRRLGRVDLYRWLLRVDSQSRSFMCRNVLDYLGGLGSAW